MLVDTDVGFVRPTAKVAADGRWRSHQSQAASTSAPWHQWRRWQKRWRLQPGRGDGFIVQACQPAAGRDQKRWWPLRLREKLVGCKGAPVAGAEAIADPEPSRQAAHPAGPSSRPGSSAFRPTAATGNSVGGSGGMGGRGGIWINGTHARRGSRCWSGGYSC